jgi:uncharacterized protein
VTRFSFWLILCGLVGASLLRAEPLPPKPARHFNDYARLVSPSVAQALDARLAQFERETSNQILVAIYPKMNSDSSVEDFTVRTAESWRVGQKGRDNGAVLFIFVQDRQAYISTGYGLEGALPDALCFQIINQELTPRFRTGDYAGGITAAVNSMIAATRGEYKALPARGVANDSSRAGGSGSFIAFLLFVIIASAINRLRGNRRRSGWGHRGGPMSGPWLGGGGGFGGFGGGSSGGGGFSGGGGSFGGGGAGGKW